MNTFPSVRTQPGCARPRHLVVLLIPFLLTLAAFAPRGTASAQSGLKFDGIDDYVTFGPAVGLGASTFTLETWFRRDGAGVTANTGTGGITAVPLITKGRHEADGSTADMNYFLGIDATGVLAADFEEGAGGGTPGLNHPVKGVTPIQTGLWYHAAVTYDGTTWNLYLNGVLEASTAVGQPPRSDSQQHAGLATAMSTAGVPEGFFNGALDEVRVWNVARSQGDIQATMFSEITTAEPGLLGAWGMNESAGSILNSVPGSLDGTLMNGPGWVGGSPFALAFALDFGGSNAHVGFGNPASLKLSQFTLEMWLRRDGTGTGANTGSGGISDAIPLLTKGMADAEVSSRDINYFFGIKQSSGVLCADFEEDTTGASRSLNHPILGSTPIPVGGWHHVAVTYDGTWRLYLDGVPDGELAVNRPPGFSSDVPVALGRALILAGTASGAFDGVIDEVRVWSVARTPAEIQGNVNVRITTPQSGLVARWGLDEGAGTVVNGSAGTSLTGSITGTAWTWAGGAPFNVGPPTPPAAPTLLSATAPASSQVELLWTDNSNNETTFEIERSTTGSGGPFTLAASVGTDVSTYADGGREASTEYCYRVRAVNAAGPSDYSNVACVTTPGFSGNALDFGGSDAYVLFGNPATLKLSQFTLEMWLRRDGTGTGISTGTGGVSDAVPLLTKGSADTEVSSRDINYYFGIRQSSGVLCADFEEDTTGASKSLNHPILGSTPIPVGGWHHVAVTYDGTWRLYLDGVPDGELAVNQPPGFSSDVPLALGRAVILAGTASGAFDGVMDEVRVWNVARTSAEIQATINSQIATPTANLVARWALDEGTGTTVHGSAGTTIDGTVTGAAWSWVGGAPFNIGAPGPPTAPSGLTASAASSTQVLLGWVDNSGNEVSFEIERSTTGSGGPFAPLATVGANTTSYYDGSAEPSTPYCYRVRAVNGSGASGYTGVACATTPASSGNALDFGGSDAYVGFGNPASLKLSQFTLEMWLRRDGTGTGANTGSGGISDAVPLLTKGMADQEVSSRDINYYFGIKQASGVLCADFEEDTTGASRSLNHPILGSTPIPIGGWHHVAVTYDGSWRLYLDGLLDGELAVNQPPGFSSDVPVALGRALILAGTAAGAFDGVMDEVRVWNVARTAAEIVSTANTQLTTPQPGLVARWALDEGAGTSVGGSAGTTIGGTIQGAAWAWVPGAPFNLDFNQPPASPALAGPADDAMSVARPPTLSVDVSDPDGTPLTVSFYGRPLSAAGPDFTLIGLPDTQYYTGALNGGSPAILNSQTQWIVDNIAGRNIPYTVQLGDCVEHGDNGGDPIEWQRADAGFLLIENPLTTGMAEGLPYGICAGNHDQTPIGDADGSTAFYNQYFGINRFQGRSYYGGHYGSTNDNWFDLFSASGMDFIVIGLEYDTTPDAAVLTWADQLLTTYANRRAIVASHYICGTGNPASFGTQGQAIYNALKGHTNLFLMLCGHVPGEGRRVDTFGTNTVHTLLSDYQNRTNGGNGWLRILEFSPTNNVIRVRTYSPWLGQYEADADSSSQFTLSYPMSGTGAFQLIGTAAGVASGGTASIPWPGLAADTAYEWYVTVSDGSRTVTGPTWSFTTAEGVAPAVTVTAPNGGEQLPLGEPTSLTWTATDNVAVTSVDVLLSRSGPAGPFETIAAGVANNGSLAWTITGPVTADAYLRVVAHDAGGNQGEDLSDAAFTILNQTGVAGPGPAAFSLAAITPNPSRAGARIGFEVPRESRVRLQLLDVQGRIVATMADGVHPAGRHEVVWRGAGVTPGLYFVRMQAPGFTVTRRFLVVR